MYSDRTISNSGQGTPQKELTISDKLLNEFLGLVSSHKGLNERFETANDKVVGIRPQSDENVKSPENTPQNFIDKLADYINFYSNQLGKTEEQIRRLENF